MKKWNIGNFWKKYKYVGLVVLAGILLFWAVISLTGVSRFIYSNF